MTVCSKSISDYIQDIEFWLRLATFLHEPLKNALLCVLHNTSGYPSYKGLPKDPKKLYQELKNNHETTIKKLLKKNILSQEQFDLILPAGNETDSKKFDITLIVVLIRNCTTLSPPINGWADKNPPPHDTTIAAACIRGREWRNFVHHYDPNDIDEPMFEQKWAEGTSIIAALGYFYDTNKLKQSTLDPKHEVVLDSLFMYLARLQKVQDQQQRLIYKMQETSKVRCKMQETIIEEFSVKLKLISEEVEHLKEPKNLIEQAISTNEATNDTCVQEVFDCISEKIEDDWEKLMQMLPNDSKFSEIKTEEDALKYFKSIWHSISWQKMKRCLENIERADLIDYIEKQTLITQGIKLASWKLKKYYITELINQLVNQPLVTTTKAQHYVPFEEEFIDLAILTAEQVDEVWNNSDREALLKRKHLQMSKIQMDEILQQNDECVIVRGAAGIGKSTLMRMYTLKWAKNEILHDKDTVTPSIDFVFLLTCKELNTFNELKDFHTFIIDKYPDIFEGVNYKIFERIADRVLIIVDGTDELHHIYTSEDRNTNVSQSSKFVFKLIDSKTFLKGHKSIVSGRPKACEFLKSRIIKTQAIKTIEVCGFNCKSVRRYVEKFFGKQNETACIVSKRISGSKNLNALASVPVFLWVICNVYGEDLIKDDINTNTELYFYAFLVFIQNHCEVENACDRQNLIDLVNDRKIAEILFSLAALSVKTYMNNQVLFGDEDIANLGCPIHLEKTGLIVKYSQSNLQRPTFQFKHLVLQEFLCSLYLCLTKDIKPFKCNEEFESCTPTILGILRLMRDENPVFVHLFSHLTTIKQERDSILNFFRVSSLEKHFNLEMRKFELTNVGISNFITNGILHLTNSCKCTECLANIFESKYIFLKPQPRLSIVIDHLHSSTAIRDAAYLLTSALKIENIVSTELRLFSLHKLTDDIAQLVEIAATKLLTIRIQFGESGHCSTSSIQKESSQSVLTIFISFENETINSLPERIKRIASEFIVFGNGLSSTQRRLLLDIAYYVVSSPRILYVRDGADDEKSKFLQFEGAVSPSVYISKAINSPLYSIQNSLRK